MRLADFSEKFIYKTRIDLGNDEFISLREPTTAEIADFSDDASKNMKVMERIFPKCIVDSSFENNDGNKATGQEVYNALKDSGSLFTEIIGEWMNSIPFAGRLQKKGK